jgi:hypothetical protein
MRPDSKLWRTITANIRNGRTCEVSGCFQRVRKVSRYCPKHHGAQQRVGHPLGRTIRASELAPYRKLADTFIARNSSHIVITETLKWLQEYVNTATERTPHLLRLRKSGTTPAEMLSLLVAMFLMLEHDEARTIFRDDTHFRRMLAVRFLRLAPAPFRQTFRGGRGGRYYPRMSVTMQRQVTAQLERNVGAICMKMARTILERNKTPAGLLRGVQVPFD